ncbi:hypothetical protein SPRG_10649 [Saprolegnia parasitica CBS 223.65]|uniref:SH3 domain-containing protein n=1 Tax=Saprolegnia parasitica (strain CBS 223.65) TaxID=695850 RepID=A0A067C087_SAPPC|nr:hypothetical protein SPRG_10649 [Saprolegnia parasitica CBS 223.65]KDO23953.1 hypothetical protein SPRG_10649 [Saprolegnia parasitica CBS 223.65]|eukprot:XP_012205275.1 hypothetical protein SPRG_10649 [Saprolegnia parasitica CBS 223.65]
MLPALTTKPKQPIKQIKGLSNDSIDAYANAPITSSSTSYVDTSDKTPKTAREPTPPDDENASTTLARALRDRKPKNDEELTLKAGDLLTVHSSKKTGYLKCECNGKVGYVPASYVEFLDKDGAVTEAPSSPRKKKKKAKKKSHKKRHSSDEDDVDLEEEEEEEAETPRKSARKAKAKKRAEDDVDIEEEEEAETPRKSKKKHRRKRHHSRKKGHSSSESSSDGDTTRRRSSRHRRHRSRRRHDDDDDDDESHSSDDASDRESRSRRRKHKQIKETESDPEPEKKSKTPDKKKTYDEGVPKGSKEAKQSTGGEEIVDGHKEDKVVASSTSTTTAATTTTTTTATTSTTGYLTREQQQKKDEIRDEASTSSTNASGKNGNKSTIGKMQDKMRSILGKKEGNGTTKKSSRSKTQSNGILNACPGTVQGEEGWYEHGECERYYFILIDGKWSLLYGPMTDDDYELFCSKVLEYDLMIELPPTHLHKHGYYLDKDFKVRYIKP